MDVRIVNRPKRKYNKFVEFLIMLAQLPRIMVSIATSDFVVVFPNPFMPFYVLLGKACGKRVIIDHFNSYVTQKECLRYYPLILDRLSYRLADCVVAISESLKEEMTETYGLRNVVAVPPVLDVNLFSPKYVANAERIKEKLKIKGKFVVMYHGMHHPWHGLYFLLEASKLLKNGREIVFVVIPRDSLDKLYTGNVAFLDELPYEELPKYIQIADVWCSGFDIHPRGERTLSSTLIQALAMGKPVVTSPTSRDKVKLLKDGKTAFFVEPRSAKAIAGKILECRENRAHVKKVGRNARRLAERLFSTSELDRVLAKIFKELQ